jgi:hypothetical protein
MPFKNKLLLQNLWNYSVGYTEQRFTTITQSIVPAQQANFYKQVC